KKIVPDQEYILLPLLTSNPSLSKSSKDSPDAGFKPSGEEEKMDSKHPQNEDNEVPNTEEPRVNQEQDANINNTNNINTIIYFDDEKVGAEADMNNLATTVPVYKNKKDDRGIVVKNKARMVAEGYTQEEGIDYDKVFAPVARIEAIRLFLAYASFMNFIVYQMDMKSAFLYDTIEEEVYVCQPLGFEDPEFPNKVYKVEKTLYGLHQAPRAWYETLSTYVLENGFRRGTIDKTLFIKKAKIPDEFYEGAHFLLRVVGSKLLQKTSHLHAVKRIFRYLKGNLQQEVLWIQNQLLDYGYNFMNTKIFIDNESIICIVKNPVFHSRTKHIEIRHHFIRDSYDNRLIQVIKIHTNHNVANLLQKPKHPSTFPPFDVSTIFISDYKMFGMEWGTNQLKLDNSVCAVKVGLTTGLLNVLELLSLGRSCSYLIPFHSIITQPSSSKPQKKKSRRKQRKDIGPIKPIPDEATNEEPISTPSCDPPQSGEDRLQLTKLMSLCTKLQKQVLDLEEAKTAQAKEIASIKKRVKQLEKRMKSRTSGLKRLRKVEEEIVDLDADEEVFEEPIVNVAKTTSSFLVSVADPVTIASDRKVKNVSGDDSRKKKVLCSTESSRAKNRKAGVMKKFRKFFDKAYNQSPKKEQRDELESDKSKKQKIDEHVEADKDDDHVEAEKDDDQEEADR
ncbi:putative ribonuclease H-like domain-containing protein, partial [Tanacetum coccineum]